MQGIDAGPIPARFTIRLCYRLVMPVTVTCSGCSLPKKPEDLSRKYGKATSRCLECTNAYARARYPANKHKQLEYNKQQRTKRKRIAYTLKSSPCMDCNRLHSPWQMDFDHVRGKKLFNVSAALMDTSVSMEIILSEMDKCDLVCSNCHRNRTHRRSGSEQVMLLSEEEISAIRDGRRLSSPSTKTCKICQTEGQRESFIKGRSLCESCYRTSQAAIMRKRRIGQKSAARTASRNR